MGWKLDIDVTDRDELLSPVKVAGNSIADHISFDQDGDTVVLSLEMLTEVIGELKDRGAIH